MGSINPNTGMAIFIVLAAIVSIVCNVIRTYNGSKSKPATGESLATIGAKLQALDRDLEETKRRHTAFEAKMTTQNGDIWKAIDTLITAVSKNGGKLDLFIDEIRDWRNNHAKDNHS